jgi:hypothetical protein
MNVLHGFSSNPLTNLHTFSPPDKDDDNMPSLAVDDDENPLMHLDDNSPIPICTPTPLQFIDPVPLPTPTLLNSLVKSAVLTDFLILKPLLCTSTRIYALKHKIPIRGIPVPSSP